MDLKFINRKKGTVLLHDGRQYYKLRTYKNGNVFWTCSNLKKQKCRGSITLKNDQIVKCGDHSCTADYAKNEMDAAMDALKKTATSTSLPIPQLYRETKNVLKDRGLNFVRIIPSFDNIKSTLYSRRSKTCFKNIAEVSIPDQLRFFLLAEYSTENSKILVFCSEHGKELLAKPNEFFCDGTFFSCPKPFKQMYSIHADVAQSRLTTNLNPAAYALMTDKKEESYTALFQMIKSQIPQWTPKKIHIDFETAASNALIQIFPNLHIKKCYYHFNKSLWKRAKELKIQSKIQNRIVGLCSVLPLLPVDEIDAGWEYIISECHKNDKIEKFIKYFEKTWLKDKSFISEWSVFGERHRSNNAVESWHAQLNHQMKKYRPITISRLLSTLLKMEDDHATNGDNEPSPRRNEHISRDDFIMKCQLEFLHKEISIGHFLDKLR